MYTFFVSVQQKIVRERKKAEEEEDGEKMLDDGTIQRSASLDNNLYLILAIHNDDLSHQRHWKAEPSSRGRFFIHNNAWMSLLWQLSRLYHHHHLSFVLFAKAGCDS